MTINDAISNIRKKFPYAEEVRVIEKFVFDCNNDISKKYYVDYNKRLLDKIIKIEEDHNNLSLCMAEIDLNSLKCLILSEIRNVSD